MFRTYWQIHISMNKKRMIDLSKKISIYWFIHLPSTLLISKSTLSTVSFHCAAARQQLVNLRRTNLPRRTYYLRRRSSKNCRNMYKVREREGKSGKGEGQLGVEKREKDSQPIEPCLDVLTHTPKNMCICTVCLYAEWGRRNKWNSWDECR